MTSTFGELADAAEVYLSRFRRYPLFMLDQRELIQVAAAIRSCVDGVVRLAATAQRDGRPILDPDAGWQKTLESLAARSSRLSLCTSALPRLSDEVACVAPAHRLARASTAIGGAVDLLATHFEVVADGIGYRDEFGTYIDSVEGRRDIASQVARLAWLLSPTGRDLALAIHGNAESQHAAIADALLDISEELGRVARYMPDRMTGAGDLPALAAIPALEVPRRGSVTATRDVGDLLDMAVGCAERLQRLSSMDASATPTPTTDPEALAVTASAIASSQAMTARLLRHLKDHGEHVAPALTAERVVRATHACAEAAERSYQRWIDVRDGLRGGRGLITHGLGMAMRVEAVDLVLSVGRLVHEDPHWAPRVGGNNEMRAMAELAPDRRLLGELCAGLNRLATVQALTANRQANLVRAMASAEVFMLPTRSLPESDDVRGIYTPIPDDETAALIKRYVVARDASAEAARRIGALPRLLGGLRVEMAAEVELTHWRLPYDWRNEGATRFESHDALAVAL
jgi:hypothetical protein